MGRLLRCLTAAVFMVVVSVTCLPRIAAQSYLYGTGDQTWGINIPIENGFINVANGQVHLEIALASHPQRGSLSLNEALVYDSRIWHILANGSSYSFQPTNVPNSMSGWRFISGADTGSMQVIPQVQNVDCYNGNPSGTQPAYTTYWFNWTDPTGAVHEFPVQTQQPISGFCSGAPPGQYTLPDIPTASGYAADSTGYYITVSNYQTATVFDPNGNEVYPAIIDRNGNTFSTDGSGNLVDTLGRTPVKKTTSGNLIYYDVLTIGGVTKRYTVTTETIYVHTAFSQSSVNEYSNSLTAVQSIGLPDGSSYSFTYDSGTTSGNYGELQSITLPTGGTVQLGYQNYLDSYQNQNRWLASYSGGKGSYTFAPQVVTSCTGSTKVGCQEKMSVTDGNGNLVTYLLTLNNGAWNSQADYYNGTSAHVMSTATTYNISTACGTYNCVGSQYITASTVATTLSDTGQMAQTQYSYAAPAIAKPTAVKMWDYYTGTPSSTPTKETDYTYGYSVNGAAFVTHVSQLDSSGNPAAQTTYVYDYGTTGGCPSGSVSGTSGLPSHQAAPGTRGNLACTISGISPVSVMTSATYDDAGTKLSDTDGRGNQTTYATMCSDAYVQTVSLPVVVNGNHLRAMTTYDCPSALPVSSQDANGVVSALKTSYQYFTSGTNIGKLQAVSYPDGGSSTYTYVSATETDQAAKQTSTVNVTTKSMLDSYGRPYQSVTLAPEGTITAETSYDSTGKPSCVWTPHLQGTTSNTDGSTCTRYDVLGRVTQTTMADNNSSTVTYAGATKTVKDELGHQKKYTYDAFHRLTTVLEPDATGTLSYETDYVYNALDALKQVDQWGGANGVSSPGDRQRVFAYDSLGRLIAQNIPENQTSSATATLTCSGTTAGTKWTTCFVYDANGNLTQTTDNAGKVINYTYDAVNRILTQAQSTGAFSYSYKYDGTDGYSHTNALGYLTYSTNNNASAGSSLSYDSMGRLTNENVCVPSNCTYGTSGINIAANYDLAGNMLSVTYPDGRQVGQTFDSANRFKGVQYSKWGTTTIGSSYYSVSAFAPPGQPTQAALGNGDGVAATFNNRQSIASLSYTNSGGTIWSKQFTWDKNATNLLLLTDNLTGNGRQFSYDTLNRITSAQDVRLNPTGSTATLSISGSEQSYTFNPCPPNTNPCPQTVYDGGGDTVYVNGVSVGGFGWSQGATSSTLASQLVTNINNNSNSPVTATLLGTTSVILTSKTTGATTNYPISVTTSWTSSSNFSSPSFTISAPSSMTGGASGGTLISGGLNESYGYDPFGNLTQSGNFGFSQSFNKYNQMSSGFNYDANGEETADVFSHALTYDAGGMLSSVAGSSETYVYDAQGNRVEVHGSAVTDFIYFDGSPIAMLSGGAYTDLIFAGSTLIAEVGGTQSAVPTYRVTDNLSSLVGYAPSTGPITGTVNYAPYGQTFSGSTSDPFGFTGLKWDGTTALWHADARQFSPQQGRWITPDPYSGSYNWADPQSLNRYAYVNGRPTFATDPTGMMFCGTCGAPPPPVCGPVCVGIDIGIEVGVGIYDLGKMMGWWGSRFHGSLKPRPNAPWSEHMGGITPLGAPVGSLSPLAGIAGLNQAIGLPSMGAGCEFGPCGGGPTSSFQAGAIAAGAAGTATCVATAPACVLGGTIITSLYISAQLSRLGPTVSAQHLGYQDLDPGDICLNRRNAEESRCYAKFWEGEARKDLGKCLNRVFWRWNNCLRGLPDPGPPFAELDRTVRDDLLAFTGSTREHQVFEGGRP